MSSLTKKGGEGKEKDNCKSEDLPEQWNLHRSDREFRRHLARRPVTTLSVVSGFELGHGPDEMEISPSQVDLHISC